MKDIQGLPGQDTGTVHLQHELNKIRGWTGTQTFAVGGNIHIGVYTKSHREDLLEISKLENTVNTFCNGNFKLQLMHKKCTRGKKGYQDWVQLKASFQCKVRYGAGRKRSRGTAKKRDGERSVVAADTGS